MTHWPRQTHDDRRNFLLSAGLVLLSIVATVPVLEMGMNDDWAYAYTTQQLALTGSWHFTGWGSPMVGAQAAFGALVIRAAGFSFTALRLTTAVFAVGCALLLYRLGRLTGLNPSFALFGTLSIVLSPVFIPLAASFMTDVPGLFFLLACFYCGAQALDARDSAHRVFWLIATAVVGFLGGTVRQVIWGAPLLMIPAVIWLKPEDRRTVGAGAGVCALVAIGVGLCLRWLGRQDYFIPESVPNVPEILSVVREVHIAPAIRTSLIFILPALVIHVFGWWRLRRCESPLTVGAIVLLAVPGILLPNYHHVLTGDLVSPYGLLYQGIDAMGTRPLVAPNFVFFGLASFGIAAIAVCLVSTLRGPSASQEREEPIIPPAHAFWLAGPFCLAYTLLLLYRSGYDTLYDRYLIVLLPAFNLPLLLIYQRKLRPIVPIVGWFALFVVALFGVGITHDYFASARARLAAASALTARGVPRTAINGGLEYDGWTELLTRGYVNDSRIRVPPNAYKPPERMVPAGIPSYWLLDWTPSIRPEYFVVYSRQPSLVDSIDRPVPYSTWLPPARREMLIQKVDRGSEESGSAATK